MIVERDGKFYRLETTEKEISEIEFLKAKIKELEEKISEISRQPTIISYPVIYPCPNSPDITPWNPTYPTYETEPYRITITC